MMIRPFPTRSIAALCILAFALGHLVSVAGVRCRNASGNVRVEFACIKTAAGFCSTTRTARPRTDYRADAERPDEPCRDEPLGQQPFVAKVFRAGDMGGGGVLPLDLATPVPAAWATWNVWLAVALNPVLSPGMTTDRARPPDSLARLRTVRLVV